MFQESPGRRCAGIPIGPLSHPWRNGVNGPVGAHTSAYWLARADEARTRADAMQDGTACQTMLSIAEKYEHLAERAARREKAAKPG